MRQWLMAVALAGMGFLCLGARAQNTAPETVPPPPDGPVIFYQQVGPGPGAEAGQVPGPMVRGMGMPGGDVRFVTTMAGAGKVVTGASYSAEAVTETTQILADGNQIVNKLSASVARDNQGRTRREETLRKLGPWQVNGGSKVIFISDPVSQTDYVLNPDDQTAHMMKRGKRGPRPEAGATVGSGPGAGAVAMFGPGPVVRYRARGDAQNPEAVTESLGTQVMDGISVQGKRVTRTIPAGEIGNAQPLVIVSEVWYSPDLQEVISSTQKDPRFGETDYQLTGINRAAPDASLFQVPASYTIKTGPPIPPVPLEPGTTPPPPPPGQ